MSGAPAILLLLAAIVVVPANAAAQESEPPPGTELYGEAVTAFQNGEFDRAADLFGRLYAIQPDPLVLYNRSYAFGRAGRYSAAIEAAALADLGGLDESSAAKNRARLVAYGSRLTAEAAAEAGVRSPRPVVRLEEPAPLTEHGRGPWLGLAIVSGSLAAGGAVATAVLDGAIARDVKLLEGPRADEALGRIESRQRIARPLFVASAVALAAAGTFVVIHLLKAGPAELAIGPGNASFRVGF